ncbi:OpgC family protein [uncultured Enterovirga sp.]|uniref:OpgC family protein n=1 Tax=uncultured Enterovirga sp. TaxID=2026352 RepID=UPI0035CBAFD5
MRVANEIDFWRGLALVSIFVNHVPGFSFERFTHRNYGLSDSAELFVFLAGWGLRHVATTAQEPLGLPRLVLRLGARAVTLYAAQILITMLAIATIASAALLLDNPLLLESNNAAAVFQDPVPTHLGLVLLSHQLGYFDILPLYVVLMFGAPAMAIVHRLAPRLLLPLSIAIYAAALTFRINLPTWPVDGVWFFDPFAWQLIFVLGFVLGAPDEIGGLVRRHLRWLRPIAWVVVVVGAWVVLIDYEPDPTRVPDPTLFFVFDKTFLSPARLLHFLAVAAAFAGSFRYIARFLRPVARFLSMLGRNSLNVFCVGSLLSLVGQFLRVAWGGGLMVDGPVLLLGIAVLGSTAWLSELRDRLRLSAPPSSPVS